MLTYYITGERPRIAEVFAAGVDFVQLRGQPLLPFPHFERGKSKLLVNDRADIAAAYAAIQPNSGSRFAGADGVHLPANRPPASEYRKILPPESVISVACHSQEDVERAAAEGADYAILAPIFRTPGKGEPIGLRAIARAARTAIPVIALGGVTRENARDCRDAGAAGIAAIRLFEESADLPALIAELHAS